MAQTPCGTCTIFGFVLKSEIRLRLAGNPITALLRVRPTVMSLVMQNIAEYPLAVNDFEIKYPRKAPLCIAELSLSSAQENV